MHQITADEFNVFQRNHSAQFTGLFPPGRKNDLLFIDRKDTTVRNGNLVGISSEIFYSITKSMKNFFYVRMPYLSVKENKIRDNMISKTAQRDHLSELF